jgi:acetyl esterase
MVDMGNRRWISALLLATGALQAGLGMAAENAGVCGGPQTAALIQAQPESLEGATSFIYRRVDGAVLRAHVFKGNQAGTARTPAMIFFYGGGWMWGNVTDGLPIARHFSARGIPVVLVDYRVYCRQGVDVLEEMDDAKAAVAWVRRNAGRLGVDPERLIVSGSSAGGHLALSTAVFGDRKSRPNYLAVFFPCTDLTRPEDRTAAVGLHGEDVSPFYHVAKSLPPMLLLQGTADPLYDGNKEYCEKVGKRGGRCRMLEFSGAPHGFLQQRIEQGRWQRESIAALDRELTMEGYLKPSM